MKGIFMISKEYNEALELIIREVWPIGTYIEDMHKTVSAFKMLIEKGYDLESDDIFHYLVKERNYPADVGATLSDIHRIVKATLNTELGWDETFLQKRLFKDQSPTD